MSESDKKNGDPNCKHRVGEHLYCFKCGFDELLAHSEYRLATKESGRKP